MSIPVHIPVLVWVGDRGHEAHVNGGHVRRGDRIDELFDRGHFVEPEANFILVLFMSKMQLCFDPRELKKNAVEELYFLYKNDQTYP